MKIMHCPLNGPRNISEFVWAGDVKSEPDPSCTDAAWAEHLFLEDNLAGEVDEWWLHAPSNTWFVARRNTLTDEIVATMSVESYMEARRKPVGQDATGTAAASSTGGEA